MVQTPVASFPVVLSQIGRYHKVADNLEVKEVSAGECCYVVCHNEEEEKRDRKQREEIIERVRENLKRKGPQAFALPRGLRRFVEPRGGELVLKEAPIQDKARYDGKWALRTNTELPTEEEPRPTRAVACRARLPRAKERAGDKASVPARRRQCAWPYCGLLPGPGHGDRTAEDARAARG